MVSKDKNQTAFNSVHNQINADDLKKRILSLIENAPDTVDKQIKSQLTKLITNELDTFVSLIDTKRKSMELELLYTYQKSYLDLIKEYKEEIKFVNATQEELRKERTKFFAQGLQEVHDTLKKAEIDKLQSNKWIQELVESYTNSLDLSSELVKVQVSETIEKLKVDSSSILNDIKENNLDETKS